MWTICNNHQPKMVLNQINQRRMIQRVTQPRRNHEWFDSCFSCDFSFNKSESTVILSRIGKNKNVVVHVDACDRVIWILTSHNLLTIRTQKLKMIEKGSIKYSWTSRKNHPTTPHIPREIATKNWSAKRPPEIKNSRCPTFF